MGIEIECLVDCFKSPKIGVYHGFWYITADASINVPWDSDYSAREFVSQPLTKNWLKKEVVDLYKEYEWDYNDSCGIHIHFNREALSKRKIGKIDSFLRSLYNSERVSLFGRPSCYFCDYNRDPLGSRYVPVNILNPKTVEFRMFSSGDGQWACYCIEVVSWLVKNANHLTVDGLIALKQMHYPSK
jgi:hypothetical protein